ncbi:hypothetical protein K7432_000349 [Basidiobolus ranarum]|uniref:Yeast cell wall synthesis Kre9/Knh1-like N-terminal domain-containing protein n=1 Tax=Basidiobolus ranarum TaxID=34480 RepID=A0ABR2X4P0_9FUNG
MVDLLHSSDLTIRIFFRSSENWGKLPVVESTLSTRQKFRWGPNILNRVSSLAGIYNHHEEVYGTITTASPYDLPPMRLLTYLLFSLLCLLVKVQADIYLTDPIRGTVWNKGDSVNIKWVNFSNMTTVEIGLAQGSAQSLTLVGPIASGVDPKVGTYTWIVPGTISPGNSYSVRIGSNGLYYWSHFFTIRDNPDAQQPPRPLLDIGRNNGNTDPSTANNPNDPQAPATPASDTALTITHPTDSTIWKTGEQINITWMNPANNNSPLEISLSMGSLAEPRLVTKIALSVDPRSQSLTWIVPETLTPDSNYFIRMGNPPNLISSRLFTIQRSSRISPEDNVDSNRSQAAGQGADKPPSRGADSETNVNGNEEEEMDSEEEDD